MPRQKKTHGSAAPLFDVRVTTAPCVLAIREKVGQWRDRGYQGATDTTRRLLNYWFHTDHRLANGRKFAYHWSQREAAETLIYLYEIAKVRCQKKLIETYAHIKELKLLQYDQFARYCVKMATGSGKTKVMALAIAWQYFNAVAEASDDYAKAFLVIAPNVIVFERLRTDFGGGRIFQLDPVCRMSCKSFGISNATCAAKRSGPARPGRFTSPTFTSCTKRRQTRLMNQR
jgi:type III restriction enzyme